jgi:hypothetical protein
MYTDFAGSKRCAEIRASRLLSEILRMNVHEKDMHLKIPSWKLSLAGRLIGIRFKASKRRRGKNIRKRKA